MKRVQITITAEGDKDMFIQFDPKPESTGEELYCLMVLAHAMPLALQQFGRNVAAELGLLNKNLKG